MCCMIMSPVVCVGHGEGLTHGCLPHHACNTKDRQLQVLLSPNHIAHHIVLHTKSACCGRVAARQLALPCTPTHCTSSQPSLTRNERRPVPASMDHTAQPLLTCAHCAVSLFLRPRHLHSCRHAQPGRVACRAQQGPLYLRSRPIATS